MFVTAQSKPKIPIKIKVGHGVPSTVQPVRKSNKWIYDQNQTIKKFRGCDNQEINASYFPQAIQTQSIDDWMSQLTKVPFRQVQYNKFGTLRKTPRQTYCYGQYQCEPTAKYRGHSFETEAFPNWLIPLKEKVEQLTNRQYNAVIINQYVNGQNHISWHADSEPFLAHQMIASITLGQERDFQFRKSPQDIIHEISLQSGSLMVFDEGLLHCLPKRANQNGTRYNITFRCVKNSTGIGNYYYYNRGCSDSI